jgi:hypothetical protein
MRRLEQFRSASLFLRSPFSVIKSSRKEGTAASEQIEGIFI